MDLESKSIYTDVQNVMDLYLGYIVRHVEYTQSSYCSEPNLSMQTVAEIKEAEENEQMEKEYYRKEREWEIDHENDDDSDELSEPDLNDVDDNELS